MIIEGIMSDLAEREKSPTINAKTPSVKNEITKKEKNLINSVSYLTGSEKEESTPSIIGKFSIDKEKFPNCVQIAESEI